MEPGSPGFNATEGGHKSADVHEQKDIGNNKNWPLLADVDNVSEAYRNSKTQRSTTAHNTKGKGDTMRQIEKDFRAILDKAVNDNTPLNEQDSKTYRTEIAKTYGELNQKYLICYDRGLITFREVLNIIGDNMNKSTLTK